MGNIYHTSPKELFKWLGSNEAVLIDVREPAEFASESIDHARNLPLSLVTIDEAHLPQHRDKRLVIHCQSGKRSMMACEKLKLSNAPFDIWNLEGGIVAWKENGLPLKSTGRKILPLDRQVQLTVGVIILTGMILGHWVHSIFFILPIIAGIGLMNAGLTGWCGMAKMISKIPWNQVH